MRAAQSALGVPRLVRAPQHPWCRRTVGIWHPRHNPASSTYLSGGWHRLTVPMFQTLCPPPVPLLYTTPHCAQRASVTLHTSLFAISPSLPPLLPALPSIPTSSCVPTSARSPGAHSAGCIIRAPHPFVLLPLMNRGSPPSLLTGWGIPCPLPPLLCLLFQTLTTCAGQGHISKTATVPHPSIYRAVYGAVHNMEVERGVHGGPAGPHPPDLVDIHAPVRILIPHSTHSLYAYTRVSPSVIHGPHTSYDAI